jgi:hypothetical protein
MPSFRPLLALVLAVVLALVALWAAGTARAEEAIVLDNGAVLRGMAIREDANAVLFRLAGVGTDTRIEIRRDRILKRFSTDASGLYDPGQYPGGALGSGETTVLSATKPPAAPVAPLIQPTLLPEEEPSADEEGFLKRLIRLAVVAFPREPASRTFLAGLAFVVLLCLVGIGGRMAEIESMDLARSTILTAAIAALLAMDVLWYDMFLRADRAVWVVPAELAAWVAGTSLVMKCGVGRAVLLLAFVLFSGTLVAFAAGAVLVAV